MVYNKVQYVDTRYHELTKSNTFRALIQITVNLYLQFFAVVQIV